MKKILFLGFILTAKINASAQGILYEKKTVIDRKIRTEFSELNISRDDQGKVSARISFVQKDTTGAVIGRVNLYKKDSAYNYFWDHFDSAKDIYKMAGIKDNSGELVPINDSVEFDLMNK